MTLEQACPSEYQRAQCAFKDSMTHWNSAIRITYRISLRSSSMPEPRDPLLKVFTCFKFLLRIKAQFNRSLSKGHRRTLARGRLSTVPRRPVKAGPPKQQR
jgi:hypothetical protein